MSTWDLQKSGEYPKAENTVSEIKVQFEFSDKKDVVKTNK